MITSVIEKVKTLIPDYFEKPSIVLGLSGGADSVFLFHALARMHAEGAITLHALHINHGWRSDAHVDEAFCKNLCAEHGIPFFVEHAAEWKNEVTEYKQKTGSKEADAREIRRVILETHREKLEADFIALAHHADDQVETFFIRLIRGSGLTGLCSMQEKTLKECIIRPVLHIHKKEILAWLSSHNKSFCTDSTNNDLSFLRNRIRHLLAPVLAECDSRSIQSTLRTISHLQQEEEVLAELSDDITDNLAVRFPDKDEVWYSVIRFLNLKPALQIRVLTHILIRAHVRFVPSEKLFSEIIRFLSVHSSCYPTPHNATHRIHTWCIIKKNGEFMIERFYNE